MLPELCYRTQIGTTGEFNGNVIKGKMVLAQKYRTSSMLATHMLQADPALMAEFEASWPPGKAPDGSFKSSVGGRGSAGRGVKGAFDPPEQQLLPTSFHTILMVKFGGHPPTLPSF